MGMLLGTLTDHPRLIMGKEGVLTHPASGEEHPVLSHTKLGSQAQESSITHTLDGGPSFVLEGISVPLLPLWPTL